MSESRQISVLVTNDDGIYSEGIEYLAESLLKIAKVTVVAPDVERSAVGHAITLNNPLRVEEVYKSGRLFGYAVNGTPADCVKIGINAIMKEKPDIIISGINAGANVGTDIIYSGTVSAAIEGSIMGCCSAAISVSKKKKPYYFSAIEYTLKIVDILSQKQFPKVLLNINVPSSPLSEIKGIRLTRQGKMQFRDYFDKREDPSGRIYYWLTGEQMDSEPGDDIDSNALRDGYVSITPIHYNLTDNNLLKDLKNWNFGG